MKILFVVFDYYPSGSAEANILFKLTKELSKKPNCDVSILTSKNSITDNSFECINDITIHKVDYCTVYKLSQIRDIFKKLKIAFQKIIELICRKFRVKKFINYYLYKKFYESLKKLENFDFDFIIPTCGFFEIYLACKDFMKDKKINSKLVLYQLDPLIDNISYSKKSLNFRKMMEEDIAQSCYKVITLESIIKQKLTNSINAHNCVALNFPLISNLTDYSNNLLDFDNYRTALFVGTLDNKIRNPRYALEILMSIPNLKFIIAGSGCYEIIDEFIKKYPENIIYLGKITLDKSIKLQKQVDFLINIGNNDISFIPSKIFDFISTGKPIINFYKKDSCPTLKYFPLYNNQISIFENYDIFNNNMQLVIKFLDNNINKKIEYTEIREKFFELTVDYVSQCMYGIFINGIEI